ncbi:MAG: phospholipase D-like domain-containing protein [Massilia sp.]
MLSTTAEKGCVMRDKFVEKWRVVLGRDRVREGNTVDFYVEGAATFKAMLDAMLTAKRHGHYIYLLGWYLDLDVSLTNDGRNTAREAFDAALKRHVQIRVMLWENPLGPQNVAESDWINEQGMSFDRWGRSRRLQDRDSAAILDKLTVPLPALMSDEARQAILTAAESTTWPRINIAIGVGSHHQKVLLVRGEEGLIAFCGGVDINEDRTKQVDVQPGSPMHDVHCRIRGPAAHDLVNLFLTRWESHPRHLEIDRLRQPVALSDRTWRGRPNKGEMYVRIARNDNFVGDLSTGDACYREHSIEELLLAAIEASTGFIYIEDQYLAHLGAAAAIRKRLPHLHHVTIVVPHPTIETVFPWRRLEFLRILGYNNDTKGRIRVFYRYNKQGPRFGPYSYIHSKTWIFDDEVAVIGSANCNRRGWGFDSEVVAAMFDVPSGLQPTSFAQKLRVALWTKHLGVEESHVWSGDTPEVMKLWQELPPEASVLPYFVDPQFDYRATPFWVAFDPQTEWPWTLVDPDGARMTKCSKRPWVAQ